jgi:hypothetical protein
MNTCITSHCSALVRLLRGTSDGAATGKALAAILVASVALSFMSLATVRVWAACSDYFELDEIVLPLLCTAADDYVPGSPAAILGFGFDPGETVDLEVVRADCDDVYAPWQTVADLDGAITTSWTGPATTECVGGVLTVSAVGLTSAIQAQSIFTDNGTAPVLPWRGVVDDGGATWARIKIVNSSAEDTAWTFSNCRTAIAAASDTAETDAELDWEGLVPAGSTATVWVYGLLSGQINVATADGTVSGFYGLKETDPLGNNEWVIMVDADGAVTDQMDPASYDLPLQTGSLPDMTVEEELP